MTGEDRARRGPPLGRHAAAVAVVVALTALFSGVHRVLDAESLGLSLDNRSLADASFVLLCLILTLGAVARLVPQLRRLLPWARELGIGMFVTACLHVVMLVDGEWDVIGFFAKRTSRGIELVADHWMSANWVGLFALAVGLVLAATSNDLSQRKLRRGWKFVQRQTYTLFALAWLHTAGFVFFSREAWNDFIPWFWAFTFVAVIAQFAGFVHTVRSPRGPSPHRPPTTGHDSTPSTAMAAVGRGTAVTALWVAFIVLVFVLES